MSTPLDESGTRPQDDEVESLTRLIVVMARLRTHLETSAAAIGLSPPQAHVLLRLGNPLRLGEIAGQMHCEPSHITGIADELEQLGLAERQPDPADRRAKQLVATQRGHEMRQRFIVHLLKNTPILSALTADQRVTLLDLLRSADEGPGGRRGAQ
ncbi:DNA-binding transcriptional regulator, MarR family [Sinosporangium album]|uniref:DNA-binding transcriptional regulator, MarR family n=1 Tax=Sinosporangium album TaxID=504805 RepID=A0A1G7XW27_9ACTN|nr:MarR family transcriptional regulator [Sinosporangium album]SDG88412.1 DNA-binding transcriptional regulator, MarR family [Sinosporangium album]